MIDLSRKRKSIDRVEGVFAQQIPVASNIYFLCMEAQLELFYEMMQNILVDRDFPLMQAYVEGYSYEEISEMLDIKIEYRRGKNTPCKKSDRSSFTGERIILKLNYN